MVAAATMVVAGVAWGATAALLHEAAGAHDPAAARVDAIRTGLSIGAGTGGVFALLLAVRRQWHQELTATDTTFDAEARRITDLYTKAADQLGAEKAPVRLAGLYALERLAQDNPAQRQTVVNVLCAYLRMPYTPAGHRPPEDAEERVILAYRETLQEREVRLAAQRVIAAHLHVDAESDQPPDTFWIDLDLDLVGATLINFKLNGCTIRADFESATFVGNATFISATFAGDANFNSATFTDDADFRESTFSGNAQFKQATFAGDAFFGSPLSLRYQSVTFVGDVDFQDVTFSRDAWFGSTTFSGIVDFQRATFSRAASFGMETLPQCTYSGAVVTGAPGASGIVRPYTDFTDARFEQGVPKAVVQFLPSPGPDHSR
jgi:hypothetical protein